MELVIPNETEERRRFQTNNYLLDIEHRYFILLIIEDACKVKFIFIFF